MTRYFIFKKRNLHPAGSNNTNRSFVVVPISIPPKRSNKSIKGRIHSWLWLEIFALLLFLGQILSPQCAHPSIKGFTENGCIVGIEWIHGELYDIMCTSCMCVCMCVIG